ncbi:hypothetical protein EST38_g510 [Candolleomyces aberdarensis]|uniref:Peptidase A1 domain-containing protein n=1 Tax=Candolleomyces aberdarensis TaxID=2316362 RepID=A0A4Q2DY79_9AGAR|nr:hypothetical protein EST38_g510 [Candolleomyces aberdarensis]
MHSLLPLSLLLVVVQHVSAVRIPFVVSPSLARRAPIDVGNTGNAQYVANITVAGNNIPVLLDTGSSDLWVYFAKPPADPSSIKDTGEEVSLSYAVGRASGHAQRTPITLGNYTVSDQAFLLVEDTASFTGDIRSQGYQGLLGLGPNTGSLVRKKLDKKNADTILQNVFNKAGLGQNYITMLLDRKNGVGNPFKGEMTISEVLPGFENITSMPRLDVETVTRLLKSDQHWQALTDKDNGVIGPDGVRIEFDSIVPRAPDGQLVAVIDSGFTFSQVPRDIADGIYGRVKGAVYDSTNEWWLLPCGQYLNVSFNFGGRNYPVHPLDVVDDNFSKVDSAGKKVCIGSFQPITTAFSLLGHYDMILGMNFLRSAYTLYNFGSWIENGTDDHPYIQMTSLVNPAVARAEFVQLRLAGQDTISTDPRWQILPADQLQKSPVSDEEKKKKYQEMVLSRWPYILLGCLAFTVLSIGFCIWKCCCGRNKKKWSEKSALSKGLVPGRFRGDSKNANHGATDIAERDRDTDLFSHRPDYNSGEGGRHSMDNRSRSSSHYGMEPRKGENPYGSTTELLRTNSHSSLQQPPSPYHQQNFASHQQYQQPQAGYDQYGQGGGYGGQPAYQQQAGYDGYNQGGYNQNHAGYGAGYAR